jgi:hypothetical protein
MPGERDGGIWALGGYLYQTIGLLGISASISNLKTDLPGTDNDLDILIQLVNVSQPEGLGIRPEAYNQDAFIHTYGFGLTDEGVFIQFKYSAQIPPPPIGRQEVQEIIDTFDNSVRRARSSGQNVTACVLITNRRFTPDGIGEQLWQDKKIDPQRTYELREIVGISSDAFKDELREFAMRRGATERQFEAGIERLTGQIIFQAVGKSVDARTFNEALAEAFTNYPYTKPVSASDLQGVCQNRLDEFARSLRIDLWQFSPVQRDVFQDLFSLIQSRALVGLCGHGGYGKSVLLWQLLANRPSSICDICDGINIRTAWIPYLINHEFRGLPLDQCYEPIEQALARLATANRRLPKPILWLGLDGLDEVTHPDQLSTVREMVKWFWDQDKRGAQSEAVLITTSRSPDQLRNLLDLHHDYPGRAPEIIKLDQFSDQELNQAFQRTFPDLINTASLEPFDRNPVYSAYPLEQRDYRLQFPNVAPSILTSLYHPIVWRALLNLSTDVQKLALEGDQAALDELASHVIRWFGGKLRRKRLLDLEDERLLQLLTAIAERTAFGSPCSNTDWLTPTSGVCNSASISYDFFCEAERAGLIEYDSQETWHWRHAFVYNFLVGRQG